MISIIRQKSTKIHIKGHWFSVIRSFVKTGICEADNKKQEKPRIVSGLLAVSVLDDHWAHKNCGE